MADTVFRDYRGTKGVIEDATVTPRIAGKREIKPGETRGVNTKQALASERVPLKGEGERAFGAPLSTVPPVTEKK